MDHPIWDFFLHYDFLKIYLMLGEYKMQNGSNKVLAVRALLCNSHVDSVTF